MTAMSCGNCRWWRTRSGTIEGMCARIPDDDEFDARDLLPRIETTPHGVYASLVTPPHFSCSLHSPTPSEPPSDPLPFPDAGCPSLSAAGRLDRCGLHSTPTRCTPGHCTMGDQ